VIRVPEISKLFMFWHLIIFMFFNNSHLHKLSHFRDYIYYKCTYFTEVSLKFIIFNFFELHTLKIDNYEHPRKLSYYSYESYVTIYSTL